MKKILLAVLALPLALTAWANDGVLFVQGNQLVPVQETDIALTSEVLTISLCDDGFATVDVQYVLTNHSKEKTVTMGFEAGAPYNTEAPFNPKGTHPYIHDFTVVMNGQPLTYTNAVVASKFNVECDFKPLNLKEWKSYDETKMRNGEELPDNSMLYDTKLDSLVGFAYAYYFTARFHAGKNTIHHTYRYRMSYGVGRCFEVPYWLTPAMRWANRQIDDFTLRIKAPNTAKHFFLNDSIFSKSSFVVTEGVGKIRKTKMTHDTSIEITLRNGTVEWHAKDFKPKADTNIQSADGLYYKGFKLGSFYDRSANYLPGSFIIEPQKSKENQRILKNLPYASRGYVFKDKKLQQYFSQFWWYMPDSSWKADTHDFTPREWRLINKGE